MEFKTGTRVKCIEGIFDRGGTGLGIEAGTEGVVISDSRVAQLGRWDEDDVFRYYDTDVTHVMFEIGGEVPIAIRQHIIAKTDNLLEIGCDAQRMMGVVC